VAETFDFVIVGSGINSLCCAGLLRKAGHSVVVLERNPVAGGCIRTAELTLPGFRHDVMSGFHPLFVTSPTYAELGEALHNHGLEYVNTSKPTAVVRGGGEHAILYADRQQNIDAFNALQAGDGDRYLSTMHAMERDADLTFSLLGNELLSMPSLQALWRYWRQVGSAGVRDFIGQSMGTSREWLEKHFQSPLLHGLLAPWVLHTGLGPDANFSGAMNRLIAFTLEQAGMPIVKGGSDGLVNAFISYLSAGGCELICNQHVQRIEVQGQTARSVVCADGSRFTARRAVICNVTPQALYQQLLEQKDVTEQVQAQAADYRFGRADMQIHLALDTPVQWHDAELNDVAMVHLSEDASSVALAVAEADAGLLPREASVVVAQPAALDESRAPTGKGILWIQLQELPSSVKADAAGLIDVPSDGCWNDALKNAYADRIIRRLAKYIPDLETQIIGREVISPADLEALNCNLVGGDPYSGHCGINQFFLWRPGSATTNHRTPVRGLFHIGASTHPGPGLGGGSGYLVAKALTK
jgi:phytoene dehydrogenase-like protein